MKVLIGPYHDKKKTRASTFFNSLIRDAGGEVLSDLVEYFNCNEDDYERIRNILGCYYKLFDCTDKSNSRQIRIIIEYDDDCPHFVRALCTRWVSLQYLFYKAFHTERKEMICLFLAGDGVEEICGDGARKLFLSSSTSQKPSKLPKRKVNDKKKK